MKLSDLKPREATQAELLLLRMQRRLPARTYPKQELHKFIEMFLIATEELDEMQGEVRP